MPARLLLWEMAPLALLIAVVAAALMWVVARRITHPVAEVTSAIEAIARDTHSMTAEHEIAADLAHADEVKRLRFAVDHMADRVARAQLIEAQLRQSQKMEAIGRLAGGVAHDFNNILTAIRAHADLLLDDMSEWDGRRGDVEEIRKSSERAAALTAQLLAFSRNQVIEPRLLNPRVVLSEVELMLRRLMVEDIQVSITAPAELWSVRADRGQLEQVILNLSVNARDAMPHGGALRIAASNETVDSPFHTRLGVIPPGDYVAIRVTDTGLGMDLVTQSRAFEPFFTTKPVGKGTGLGLATVHGIIAQNRGYVNMVSAPAEGTTFTVYLPRARGEQEGKPMRTSGPSKPKSGSETILLVEDEPAVRALARRVLERAGFTVLESQTPADALLIANNAEQVDLILTDVVMPGMNGPELVMHLTPLWPEARVLYTSGHTDDEMIGRGLPNGDFELLHKPFSAQQLVARVRAVLTS
jgi:signal transduction histidine kinase